MRYYKIDEWGYTKDFKQYSIISPNKFNTICFFDRKTVETVLGVSLVDMDYDHAYHTIYRGEDSQDVFRKFYPLLVYAQSPSIILSSSSTYALLSDYLGYSIPGQVGYGLSYALTIKWLETANLKYLKGVYAMRVSYEGSVEDLYFKVGNDVYDGVYPQGAAVGAFDIFVYDKDKPGAFSIVGIPYTVNDGDNSIKAPNNNSYNLSNSIVQSPNANLDKFGVLFNSNHVYTETPPLLPGPYDPAGPSTSGGGDGSFDNKSDPVDFTELPSLSVFNSGFVGLFKPTLSQLNELANYLWNENLDVEWLRKLFANPIDLLISLTIMPVDPPTAGSETIKVGFRDTGISINKLENQYMSIDFGSLEVKEYYGNALDYSPYTKISIYLPYIGLKQLNTDDVMKKTLALRYNVDLFTGACVAEIKAGESVLYTFTGNIANQIPLNAESYNSFLSGLIQAAASVGVAIASHGTSVATQGAAEAGEVTAMAARGAQTASNLASMNAALTSAGAVATSKPDILHSGSMTANNGYLSGKTPYLIYEVPRACIPENYQTFVGYPSNITKALSEVSGFTVVDSIHLENVPATDSELAEIERLLKGGVIL